MFSKGNDRVPRGRNYEICPRTYRRFYNKLPGFNNAGCFEGRRVETVPIKQRINFLPFAREISFPSQYQYRQCLSIKSEIKPVYLTKLCAFYCPLLFMAVRKYLPTFRTKRGIQVAQHLVKTFPTKALVSFGVRGNPSPRGIFSVLKLLKVRVGIRRVAALRASILPFKKNNFSATISGQTWIRVLHDKMSQQELLCANPTSLVAVLHYRGRVSTLVYVNNNWFC